jgi:hypothetical protein
MGTWTVSVPSPAFDGTRPFLFKGISAAETFNTRTGENTGGVPYVGWTRSKRQSTAVKIPDPELLSEHTCDRCEV